MSFVRASKAPVYGKFYGQGDGGHFPVDSLVPETPKDQHDDENGSLRRERNRRKEPRSHSPCPSKFSREVQLQTIFETGVEPALGSVRLGVLVVRLGELHLKSVG